MNLLCLQGSSQIRQSFSKRKRGIAQKAYQLFKITDAKVPHLRGQEQTGMPLELSFSEFGLPTSLLLFQVLWKVIRDH